MLVVGAPTENKWNLILYTKHIYNIQLHEIVAMDFGNISSCPSTCQVIRLGDLKPLALFDDALRKRHAGNSRLHAFACLFFFQLEIKQICLGKRSPKKYVYLFQQQLLSNTSESHRIYITGSQSAQLARACVRQFALQMFVNSRHPRAPGVHHPLKGHFALSARHSNLDSSTDQVLGMWCSYGGRPYHQVLVTQKKATQYDPKKSTNGHHASE